MIIEDQSLPISAIVIMGKVYEEFDTPNKTSG